MAPEGWLLDANRIMRQICHFDSDEGDEFFSKMNLFEMAPFNWRTFTNPIPLGPWFSCVISTP